jgi:hypothetical protein
MRRPCASKRRTTESNPPALVSIPTEPKSALPLNMEETRALPEGSTARCPPAHIGFALD